MADRMEAFQIFISMLSGFVRMYVHTMRAHGSLDFCNSYAEALARAVPNMEVPWVERALVEGVFIDHQTDPHGELARAVDLLLDGIAARMAR